MPELPEVEVIRRQLAPSLLGRIVAQVRTSSAAQPFLTRPAVLKKQLAGRRVVSLERAGKYLLIVFDQDQRLLIHLGMTGRLFLSRVPGSAGRKSKPDPHTHLRLSFQDGGPEVCLRDPRKFGKVLLLGPGKTCPRLQRLGKDALDASGRELFLATRKRKIAIKSLLLDQSIIAGIGNIYADEALFISGISPARKAGRLTQEECALVIQSAKRVLARAIRAGGSSISDYLHPDGSAGRYQNQHRVYGRTGQPCVNCRTAILRAVIGQRSSHYCPRCQT